MTSQNFRLSGPTNFPEGVSSEAQTHPLGFFRALNPFKDIVIADDFLVDNNITTTSTYDWKVTTLSGTQGTPVVGLVDGLGGIVSIETSDEVNAETILTTQAKPFEPNSITDLFLYARMSVADASTPQIYLGFGGTTYSLALVKLSSTNRWFLHWKLGAAAEANLSLGTVPTIVSDTFFTIGLRYDWVHGKFYIYFNDSLIYTYTLATDLGGSFPGELMAGRFGIQNAGTGQVNTLLTDWVLFAQGRS